MRSWDQLSGRQSAWSQDVQRHWQPRWAGMDHEWVLDPTSATISGDVKLGVAGQTTMLPSICSRTEPDPSFQYCASTCAILERVWPHETSPSVADYAIQFVYLPSYVSLHLSVCLSVCLYVSVCLSVCLSVYFSSLVCTPVQLPGRACCEVCPVQPSRGSKKGCAVHWQAHH